MDLVEQDGVELDTEDHNGNKPTKLAEGRKNWEIVAYIRLGNCGTTNSTKEAFWAGGAKNFLKMKKHFRFGAKIFEILRVSAPKAQKFLKF